MYNKPSSSSENNEDDLAEINYNIVYISGTLSKQHIRVWYSFWLSSNIPLLHTYRPHRDDNICNTLVYVENLIHFFPIWDIKKVLCNYNTQHKPQTARSSLLRSLQALRLYNKHHKSFIHTFIHHNHHLDVHSGNPSQDSRLSIPQEMLDHTPITTV